MASAVDPAGEPIPTSAAKHIQFNCQAENVAFLKCDKCLDKGRQVTRCVLTLLKDLHQRCTAEMDMVTLDVCITIQMSMIYVAKSRRNSRTSARWHESLTGTPPSSQ